jgi:hypothetical protein
MLALLLQLKSYSDRNLIAASIRGAIVGLIISIFIPFVVLPTFHHPDNVIFLDKLLHDYFNSFLYLLYGLLYIALCMFVGAMTNMMLAPFLQLTSDSSRNIIAAGIRGAIIGAPISVFAVVFFMVSVDPGIGIGILLFIVLCMLVGAMWSCMRVAHRYGRPFPLFLLRYTIIGAMTANIITNAFTMPIDFSKLSDPLAIDELATITDKFGTNKPDTDKSDTDKPDTDERDSNKSDMDNSDTYEYKQPTFWEIINRNFFGYLLLNPNELVIYIGGACGALIRTLKYFLDRKSPRPLRPGS